MADRKGELDQGIGYYNADRPHSALGGLTPEEAYASSGKPIEPGSGE